MDVAPVEVAAVETPVNVEQVETPVNVEQPIEQSLEQPAGDPFWYSGDEYSEIAQSYESPDQLFKEFTNMKKLIGRKGIIKPGEGEDMSDFYNQIGRPETSDGYTGYEDSEESKEFFDLAFGANLTQDQANSLHKQVIDGQIRENQHVEESNALFERQLVQEYGSEFENVLDSVVEIADMFGISDDIANSELSYNKKFIDMMYQYGKQNGLVTSNPNIGNVAVKSSSLQQQLEDVRNDPNYLTDSSIYRKAIELSERLDSQR